MEKILKPSLKFLKVSTREILLLAIANEARVAGQFDEWSHRFLPYDDKISRLLNVMAQREEERQKTLEGWYQNLFGELVPPIESYNNDEFIKKFPQLQEHFFVISPLMAAEILELVLESKKSARQFYEAALAQVTQPDLKWFYEKPARFEDDHVHRVNRHLEELRTE